MRDCPCHSKAFLSLGIESLPEKNSPRAPSVIVLWPPQKEKTLRLAVKDLKSLASAAAPKDQPAPLSGLAHKRGSRDSLTLVIPSAPPSAAECERLLRVLLSIFFFNFEPSFLYPEVLESRPPFPLWEPLGNHIVQSTEGEKL